MATFNAYSQAQNVATDLFYLPPNPFHFKYYWMVLSAHFFYLNFRYDFTTFYCEEEETFNLTAFLTLAGPKG